MRLKILHVGPLPPPYGGVAVFLQSLIQSKSFSDFDQNWFNTSWGFDIERVGYKRLNLDRIVRRLSLALELRKRLITFRPDIVHFQSGSGGRWDFLGDMLLLSIVKMVNNKKILHWHRDPRDASYPGNSIITRKIFQVTVRGVDALIVLAEAYRKELSDYQIKRGIHVVPNSFDASLLKIKRPRLQDGRTRIIFLGRVSKEKGIFDILNIAPKIVNQAPDVQFVLAGPMGFAEGKNHTVDQMINGSGLEDNICLTGPVSSPEKLNLFLNSDLMIFPSYRESFGIAPLEAMAAGLPVVAYSVGAIPDYVRNGTSGYVLEVGDVNNFYLKTLSLINNYELRQQMGASARESILGYSTEKVADKVKDIYYLLLQ